MGLQSEEEENDGMTKWFEAHYAGDGFQATRISENRTRLRLPKQADNIGELITRAHEEHGAICDLSLDANGRSELTFWSVPSKQEAEPPQKVNAYTWAARISAVVAVILFLMAAAEFIIVSQL